MLRIVSFQIKFHIITSILLRYRVFFIYKNIYLLLAETYLLVKICKRHPNQIFHIIFPIIKEEHTRFLSLLSLSFYNFYL